MHVQSAVKIRSFSPEEADKPHLWAPGGVTFDSGPVEVETAPPLASIKLVFEGQEYYEVNGRTLELKAGEVGLVGPQSRMVGGIRRGKRARGLALFLPAANDGEALEDAVWSALLKPAALYRALEQPFGELARAFGGDPDDAGGRLELQRHLEASCLIARDFLRELAGVGRSLPVVRAGVGHDHSCRMIAARNDLQRLDNPRESIAALGRRYGYSRGQFTRFFRAAFGTAPREFRDTVRMKSAEAWVRTGTIPLRDIAERLGYPDYATFSKAFRRITGRAPREARYEADPR